MSTVHTTMLYDINDDEEIQTGVHCLPCNFYDPNDDLFHQIRRGIPHTLLHIANHSLVYTSSRYTTFILFVIKTLQTSCEEMLNISLRT